MMKRSADAVFFLAVIFFWLAPAISAYSSSWPGPRPLIQQKRTVVEIKLGSVAPARSPWDKALERIAGEWETLSNGSVRVRIYPGEIAGAEQDMVRKVRLGVLQGAVLTNMGLTNIRRSVIVLSLPFVFNSEAELLYVFDRIKPALEAEFEAEGFKIISWTLAGWVYFFSKGPVLIPDDLKKYKIAVTRDSPELEQIWKKMGYQVLPKDRDDIIMLQSGMISAVYTSPLVAGSAQYFALVPNMMSVRMAPLLGCMVLSTRAWASLSEELRQPMVEAARREEAGIYKEIMAIEAEAIKAMQEHGLKINIPTPEQEAEWRKAAKQAFSQLVGNYLSKDIYDQVMGLIDEYRKANGN